MNAIKRQARKISQKCQDSAIYTNIADKARNADYRQIKTTVGGFAGLSLLSYCIGGPAIPGVVAVIAVSRIIKAIK